MTAVKNQFVVGLVGCESKNPSPMTLPRRKAQSEGESFKQQEHFNTGKVSTS